MILVKVHTRKDTGNKVKVHTRKDSGNKVKVHTRKASGNKVKVHTRKDSKKKANQWLGAQPLVSLVHYHSSMRAAY